MLLLTLTNFDMNIKLSEEELRNKLYNTLTDSYLSSQLKYISGIDIEVYVKINDENLPILLDNVSVINLFVLKEIYDVHGVTSFIRKFALSSYGYVTGLILFNLQLLNIFDILGFERIYDTNNATNVSAPLQFVYYLQEITMAVKYLTITTNALSSNASGTDNTDIHKVLLGNIVIQDVYFSQPGLTIIPDLLAVQLVSQFIGLQRIYA